jgi:hypothetical protein
VIRPTLSVPLAPGRRRGGSLASTFSEVSMFDVIFIALGVAFLLGCVAYAYACEKL